MRFGPVPISEAEGAISAHSLRHGGGGIKKGKRLTRADIEALGAAGIAEVVVARLEAGDVHEDEAAARLAEALAGPGLVAKRPFTGRVNLHATQAGLAGVDRAAVDAVNRVDEAITVATLAPFEQVAAGGLGATVKIIPYAAPAEALNEAVEIARRAGAPLRIHRFARHRVGLVATRVAGTGERILDKTAAVLEERLAALGCELAREIRCAHEAAAIGAAVGELAGQGLDPIVVFGASATIDRRDMVPAGIEAAGGTVSHVGMPVDPGNLLVLAARGETRIIGAPGCARSPAENGFDWVLRRLLAGLAVTPEDITAMGVGGLLKEIKTRPQPRQGPGEKERSPGRGPIAALVLAAGQSRRMGGVHKLLEPLGGKPLVRRAAEAALASKADKVIVVTGHRGEDVRAALQGLEVEFVDNPDFAEGLSTSLRAGVAALGATTAGVVVCLGDMPDVGSELIDRLIAAFDPAAGRLIAVSAHEGKRGNPVLFAMRFRDELMAVQGDVGARHLIGAHEEAVVEVEAGKAALVDVDTPEALAAARAALGEGKRGS